MVFSSIPFLFYFLPIFLILYYIVPFKFKNAILLVFSLLFYAWGEPKYIVLLVISSVVDYANGRMIERFEENRKKQTIFLVTSIIVNLSLLGIFKYGDLFIGTINDVCKLNISLLEVALPIGISFFTFQTMSYSIDVYKGNVKAEHNFIDYMTYVSMFPQLVAGPIVRYETVSKELKNRDIGYDNFSDGIIRFFLGLFKKVLIANQVGMLFDATIKNINEVGALSAWLGIVAFALQIYFDFSGYSDMAIGMGKMMGFSYPENFNYPYTAKSITDFWKRWHITLSEWFKLYVYIPLGGNRKGKARTIINILIVWSLTGFWHGASWNFLLWGFYFAVILILEKFVLHKVLEKIPNVFNHIITLFLVLISWVLFAVEDIEGILLYFDVMFTGNGNGFVDVSFKYNIVSYGLILIVAIALSTPMYLKSCEIIKKIRSAKAKNAIYVCASLIFVTMFLVTVSYLVRNTYNPFLYFRF